MEHPECHSSDSQGQREFITGRYIRDSDGRQVPAELPTYGPCGADGTECRLLVHDFRDRKTGPEHPLAVLKCQTHGRYYTLYPLGFVPWGRTPVVPLEKSNSEEAAGAECSALWRTTLFRAAVEAASGEPAWPREGRPEMPRFWTQVRQIERTAGWLGLLDSAAVGEEVAAVLGVKARTLQEAQKRYASAPGFRERGRAVAEVLGEVALDERTLERVLRAGQMTGRCGRAWRWREGMGYDPPFRPVGTGGRQNATP